MSASDMQRVLLETSSDVRLSIIPAAEQGSGASATTASPLWLLKCDHRPLEEVPGTPEEGTPEEGTPEGVKEVRVIAS